MPGESTGGNLVINTKTFPDERSGRVSVNLGYVNDVTGKSVFVDPISGTFDDLGWDDGSRAEDGGVGRGTARVFRDDEIFDLRENESVFIPLGATHYLENPTDEPLDIIEVQSGSYLGEDDIVRFEDVYGR